MKKTFRSISETFLYLCKKKQGKTNTLLKTKKTCVEQKKGDNKTDVKSNNKLFHIINIKHIITFFQAFVKVIGKI